jgi:hypothetical protein
LLGTISSYNVKVFQFLLLFWMLNAMLHVLLFWEDPFFEL